MALKRMKSKQKPHTRFNWFFNGSISQPTKSSLANYHLDSLANVSRLQSNFTIKNKLTKSFHDHFIKPENGMKMRRKCNLIETIEPFDVNRSYSERIDCVNNEIETNDASIHMRERMRWRDNN